MHENKLPGVVRASFFKGTDGGLHSKYHTVKVKKVKIQFKVKKVKIQFKVKKVKIQLK